MDCEYQCRSIGSDITSTSFCSIDKVKAKMTMMGAFDECWTPRKVTVFDSIPSILSKRCESILRLLFACQRHRLTNYSLYWNQVWQRKSVFVRQSAQTKVWSSHYIFWLTMSLIWLQLFNHIWSISILVLSHVFRIGKSTLSNMRL